MFLATVLLGLGLGLAVGIGFAMLLVVLRTVMYVSIATLYVHVYVICYICNIGRSDLPDMYARAQGRAAPEGECGHIS